MDHHIVMVNLFAGTMAFDAIVFDAETEAFFKSSVQDELIGEVVDDGMGEVFELV